MGIKPGYKQTEVGVIPEDWEITPLDAHCSMKSGESITSATINLYSGYPCYGGNGLRGYTSRYTHNGQYILIGRQGALCGNVKTATGMFFASEHAIVVSPFDGINLKWLSYMLQAMNLNRYSESSAQPGLSVSKILSLTIPSPPQKEEQQAIADALSDMDALLDALERLSDKKRDIKQAAMQQLLTGKKRLPQFSGNWIKKRFSELAIPRKEKISSSEYQSRTTCIELENMVSEAGVLHKRPSFENYNSQKTVFKKGDILFGRLRAYLKKYWLADCDGVCSTEIWALCPDSAQITSEFLFQLIQTEQFIAAASITYGTHMPRSDWDIVKNIDFLIPTREEQNALSNMLADMDSEIIVLEARIQKTRALKQAMMQELLTGKTRLVKPEARHAGKTAS